MLNVIKVGVALSQTLHITMLTMRALLVVLMVWVGCADSGFRIDSQTSLHFNNNNRPQNMAGPCFPGLGAEIRHQPDRNTQYVVGGFGSKQNSGAYIGATWRF